MKRTCVRLLCIIIAFLGYFQLIHARQLSADPSSYQSKLSSLVPGDTLKLAAGNYTQGLTLTNINGTESQPICIRGADSATAFISRSCCNTISITKCSYLCIGHLRVEGNDAGVDAVKAEGTNGNTAHHITIEYLVIHNFQSDQQVVGINTKCPCWNWIIRKNRVLGAGTGLYLGNSDGTAPFVNGVIEYNYVSGTIGYNMEIKHQLVGVRDAYPGTAVDGKTVVARNVFTKDSSSSTGSLARPNLLVGGFAATGWGSKDYYEIYANLFYENPTEALFQGSGSMVLYNNIFINHTDGDGARAVYITSQNNIPPRHVVIFHNTVVANNSAGGIRIYNADNAFSQMCFGNAVLTAAPITNITSSFNNVSDDYANASQYVMSWGTELSTTVLIPKSAQLVGTLESDSITKNYSEGNIDFNGQSYDRHYRGAYSSCCTQSGWKLQLDTMPQLSGGVVNGVSEEMNDEQLDDVGLCIQRGLELVIAHAGSEEIRISDQLGRTVMEWNAQVDKADTTWIPERCGCYVISYRSNRNIRVQKVIVI